MRTKPVAPKPIPPPDPLDGQLDVVEVTRAWRQRFGVPSSYRDLVALAGAETEGVKQLRVRRGDLVIKSYQPLDVAYYREGEHDSALLYVQCWRGRA